MLAKDATSSMENKVSWYPRGIEPGLVAAILDFLAWLRGYGSRLNLPEVVWLQKITTVPSGWSREDEFGFIAKAQAQVLIDLGTGTAHAANV